MNFWFTKTSPRSKRTGIFPLCACAAAIVLSLASASQGQSVQGGDEAESNYQLLTLAEADLEMLQRERQDINVIKRTERRLRLILERDNNFLYRARAEEDLRQIGEILANHNLLIAMFYMDNRYGGSTGSVKASQIRLLAMLRDYPQFSKMDEVLFRLGRLAVQDDRHNDASTYFWTLVCRYPSSSLAKPAFENLDQIGVSLWEGCEKSKP